MQNQENEAGNFSNPYGSSDTQMKKYVESLSNETSMHKQIGSIDSFNQKDSLELFQKQLFENQQKNEVFSNDQSKDSPQAYQIQSQQFQSIKQYQTSQEQIAMADAMELTPSLNSQASSTNKRKQTVKNEFDVPQTEFLGPYKLNSENVYDQMNLISQPNQIHISSEDSLHQAQTLQNQEGISYYLGKNSLGIDLDSVIKKDDLSPGHQLNSQESNDYQPHEGISTFARISLSDLQAKLINTKEVEKQSQNHSGYFGSNDKLNSAGNKEKLGMFQNLDLNQLDLEEQLLDEQYRQISNNQRIPYRHPVSRATASIISSQSQANSNQQPKPTTFKYGENSIQNSSDNSNQNSVYSPLIQTQQPPNSPFYNIQITDSVYGAGLTSSNSIQYINSQTQGTNANNSSVKKINSASQQNDPFQFRMINTNAYHHRGDDQENLRNFNNIENNPQTVSFCKQASTSQGSPENKSNDPYMENFIPQNQLIKINQYNSEDQAQYLTSLSRSKDTVNNISSMGGEQKVQSGGTYRTSGTIKSEEFISGNTGMNKQHSNISQQSLLNRNTSPFNQRIMRHNSNEYDSQLSSRIANQKRYDYDISPSSKNRSLSNGNMKFSEENFKKLQAKISDYASKLMIMQNFINQKFDKKKNDQEIPKFSKKFFELIQHDAQGNRSDQLIENQQKDQEIQKLLQEQSNLQKQLQESEKKLKIEISHHIDQKGQLQILKQNLENNLERLGVRFAQPAGNSLGSKKQIQIDGYIQLVKLNQLNETQYNEIRTLQDRLIEIQTLTENQLTNLENLKNEEIQNIQLNLQRAIQTKDSNLKEITSQNKQLKEKNQDLVDQFNIANNQIEKFQQQINDQKNTIKNLEQQQDDMKKQLIDQQDLFEQVQLNLTEIRRQKEALNNEVIDLKNSQEKHQEINKQLSIDLQVKITELSLIKDYSNKQEETKTQTANTLQANVTILQQQKQDYIQKLEKTEKQLEEKMIKIEKYKDEISEQKKQIKKLEESKDILKKAMKDGQKELASLVQVHKQLDSKQREKNQDVLTLTSEIVQLKAKLTEKQQILQDVQNRLNQKDNELSIYHQRLARRNQEHLENERNFLQDLKTKDLSQREIQKKLQELEQLLEDRTLQVGYLERVRKEQNDSEQNLKKQLDQKEQAWLELSNELHQNKTQFQRETSILERTLNTELMAKEHEVKNLQQKIKSMSDQINQLGKQKQEFQEELDKKTSQLQFHQTDSSQNSNEIANKLQQEINKIKQLTLEKDLIQQQNNIFSQVNKQIKEKSNKFIKQISSIQEINSKYKYLADLPMEIQDQDLLQVFQLFIAQLKELVLEKERAQGDATQFDLQLEFIQKGKTNNNISDVENVLVSTIQADLRVEKEARQNLESILNQFSQAALLSTDIKSLVTSYLKNVKLLHSFRVESNSLNSKIQKIESNENKIKEIKTNTIKSVTLDNNKESLKEIENNIYKCQEELRQSILKLVRMDHQADYDTDCQKEKVRTLKEQVSDLRRALDEARAKKEWAELRLLEVQSQFQFFGAAGVDLAASSALAQMSLRRQDRRSNSNLRIQSDHKPERYHSNRATPPTNLPRVSIKERSGKRNSQMVSKFGIQQQLSNQSPRKHDFIKKYNSRLENYNEDHDLIRYSDNRESGRDSQEYNNEENNKNVNKFNYQAEEILIKNQQQTQLKDLKSENSFASNKRPYDALSAKQILMQEFYAGSSLEFQQSPNQELQTDKYPDEISVKNITDRQAENVPSNERSSNRFKRKGHISPRERINVQEVIINQDYDDFQGRRPHESLASLHQSVIPHEIMSDSMQTPNTRLQTHTLNYSKPSQVQDSSLNLKAINPLRSSKSPGSPKKSNLFTNEAYNYQTKQSIDGQMNIQEISLKQSPPENHLNFERITKGNHLLPLQPKAEVYDQNNRFDFIDKKRFERQIDQQHFIGSTPSLRKRHDQNVQKYQSLPNNNHLDKI